MLCVRRSLDDEELFPRFACIANVGREHVGGSGFITSRVKLNGKRVMLFNVCINVPLQTAALVLCPLVSKFLNKPVVVCCPQLFTLAMKNNKDPVQNAG